MRLRDVLSSGDPAQLPDKCRSYTGLFGKKLLDPALAKMTDNRLKIGYGRFTYDFR